MLRVEGIRLTRPGFSLTADLSMPAGSRTAVIGPSGGGKSTLLSVIAGFETPDQGRIVIDGRDMTGVPPGKRPVAMLFQDGNLFPHLDLVTNVALGSEPVPKPSAAARNRARDALTRVGLETHMGKKPGALSGGQQSRAALARLLLTERPYILLDEPFAALGPAQRREMFDLLVTLQPEATLLMVTHDPEEARRSASSIVFVDEGNVAEPVETEGFFANPTKAARRYIDGERQT